ncbi:hypothetical protein [Winogradskyella helgolandensis]|uniref:hypothetical protein n=1 Tax=Winogradskyella helgolandensis TaxID=2697010 RepID=UPI0015C9C460|nr:hypothetical protein [Winogradskyella helgolandensis]
MEDIYKKFTVSVLPQKKIEERYFGKIPKQLEINYGEWEIYWANYDEELDNEPEFEDAISTKWWKEYYIDIEELKIELDKITLDINFDNKNVHNVKLKYSKQENFIENFQFSIDLIDTDFNFLNSLLELCNQYECLLMDKNNGNLCNPNIRELAKLIEKSNRKKFLKNPIELLENMK